MYLESGRVRIQVQALASWVHAFNQTHSNTSIDYNVYLSLCETFFKGCNKNNLHDHSKEVWKNLEFSVDAPVQQNEHSKQHQLLKKYIEEIYTAVEIL